MLTLHVPKFSMKRLLDALWHRQVRGSWVEPFVQHKAQMLSAIETMRICRRFPDINRELFAGGLLGGMRLQGAGAGWESLTPMIPDPSGTSPVVTSGANALDFNCMMNLSVLYIGFIWQVAGTVTAMIANFDKTSGPGNTGTGTAKLDGTNGTITSPTIVASQAIGQIVYKNLGDTLDIDLTIGNCIHFNVTTTTTAGSGIPFVLVIPRSETLLNVAVATLSA
jgi:hypothetical protein